MQENEGLETGYGDPEVGLDAECAFEKLVVLGPVDRHELFDEQLLRGRFVDLVVH